MEQILDSLKVKDPTVNFTGSDPLTRLLKGAISSDSKALLLMTVNPDTNTLNDVVEALKFAAKFAHSQVQQVSDTIEHIKGVVLH